MVKNVPTTPHKKAAETQDITTEPQKKDTALMKTPDVRQPRTVVVQNDPMTQGKKAASKLEKIKASRAQKAKKTWLLPGIQKIASPVKGKQGGPHKGSPYKLDGKKGSHLKTPISREVPTTPRKKLAVTQAKPEAEQTKARSPLDIPTAPRNKIVAAPVVTEMIQDEVALPWENSMEAHAAIHETQDVQEIAGETSEALQDTQAILPDPADGLQEPAALTEPISLPEEPGALLCEPAAPWEEPGALLVVPAAQPSGEAAEPPTEFQAIPQEGAKSAPEIPSTSQEFPPDTAMLSQNPREAVCEPQDVPAEPQEAVYEPQDCPAESLENALEPQANLAEPLATPLESTNDSAGPVDNAEITLIVVPASRGNLAGDEPSLPPEPEPQAAHPEPAGNALESQVAPVAPAVQKPGSPGKLAEILDIPTKPRVIIGDALSIPIAPRRRKTGSRLIPAVHLQGDEDEKGAPRENKRRRRLAIPFYFTFVWAACLIGFLVWVVRVTIPLFVNVSLHSVLRSDYSADPRGWYYPALDFNIVFDILQDQDPATAHGSYATMVSMQLTPVATVTPNGTITPPASTPTPDLTQTRAAGATPTPLPSSTAHPTGTETPSLTPTSSATPSSGTPTAPITLTQYPGSSGTPTPRRSATPTRRATSTQPGQPAETNTPRPATNTPQPTRTSTRTLTPAPTDTKRPTRTRNPYPYP